MFVLIRVITYKETSCFLGLLLLTKFLRFGLLLSNLQICAVVPLHSDDNEGIRRHLLYSDNLTKCSHSPKSCENTFQLSNDLLSDRSHFLDDVHSRHGQD